MTYQELDGKVNEQIRFVEKNLNDSPVSAVVHLSKGIGFCQAVGELMKFDTHLLVQKLEDAVGKISRMTIKEYLVLKNQT